MRHIMIKRRDPRNLFGHFLPYFLSEPVRNHADELDNNQNDVESHKAKGQWLNLDLI